MKKASIILCLAIITCNDSWSQDEPKSATLNGYVSTVTSTIFEKPKDPVIIDNLIHNRINFKAFLMPGITFAAEARNRLFFGDMVRLNGSYTELIANDNGIMDLSWNLANEHSFFLNTTLDRLWLDFRSGKFQATVGRQRINWGQALIWNPNDIFNAYSYFDFDYVERPGSDAVRIQYYPGSSSSAELALKANDENELTIAGLYRFNKWGYDIQLLSGVLENDEFITGFGWSGAIGSVSLRGEGTWFQPFDNFRDTSGMGLFTIGFDKFFADNSMLQAQVLVTNKPYEFDDVTGLFTSRSMSVRDLAFSKISGFISYSYPVTPLFNAGLSLMLFPDKNGFFTGLSADYSAAENIDLTVLWQHFSGKFSTEKSKINLGFLRIKFSF